MQVVRAKEAEGFAHREAVAAARLGSPAGPASRLRADGSEDPAEDGRVKLKLDLHDIHNQGR